MERASAHFCNPPTNQLITARDEAESALADVQARAERAEAALERIIDWDNGEKPHKNLPLADCADLARKALGRLDG